MANFEDKTYELLAKYERKIASEKFRQGYKGGLLYQRKLDVDAFLNENGGGKDVTKLNPSSFGYLLGYAKNLLRRGERNDILEAMGIYRKLGILSRRSVIGKMTSKLGELSSKKAQHELQEFLIREIREALEKRTPV